MRKGSTPGHARAAGKGAARPQKPKEAPDTAAAPSPLGPFEVTRRDALTILGGIPERTFARLEAERIVTPSSRGRGGRASVYDLRQLVPAYLQYVTGARPSDERQARSRRDESQAQLNELRLERERGDLVPVGDVVLAGQNYTKAWTAMVRGLPRRLVQDGLIPREQEAGIAKHCLAILTEIAGWRTIADANRSAKGAAA